ncbi:MAG: polyprenyl diphosphate synthase [Chloroflexi bacterium]|nr:polyprenyl diphosphate synthase [Chloroflexota bacterium]
MNIPRHVAVIPDGNRRWARSNRLPVSSGHERGAEALRGILQAAYDLGISCFSFWGASIANVTKRPAQEVGFLERLFEINFKKLSEERVIHDNQVRVSVLGDWEDLLDQAAKDSIRAAIKATENYHRVSLNFFIAYDGTVDMASAVTRIVELARQDPALRVTPELIKQNLLTRALPSVDLLIRTGGAPHLSAGFLMWDLAETELYFSNKLWPDFGVEDFKQAIREYQAREKRLGR